MMLGSSGNEIDEHLTWEVLFDGDRFFIEDTEVNEDSTEGAPWNSVGIDPSEHISRQLLRLCDELVNLV